VVSFLLIVALELGIKKLWRRTGVTMQQRSHLRTGVCDQRWEVPVLGMIRENCAVTASLGCPGNMAQIRPLSSAPFMPLTKSPFIREV